MKILRTTLLGCMGAAALWATARAQETQIDTSPKWNAYIRAWHQTDMTDGAALPSQFFVKEIRFGVNGSVNEYASYKILVDAAKLVTLSSTTNPATKDLSGATVAGTDFLQDAEVDITPTKSVTLSMGQFKVPFSTDNLRSGAVTDFANRPFITNVSPAIRDIGFMTGYKFGGGIPIDLYGGLFNGTGADVKENNKTTDYVVRGVVKPMKDLGVAANYYGGRLAGKDLAMMNFGADWKVGPFFFDGEYGMKSLKSSVATVKSASYFGYATYGVSFTNCMLTNITPAIRYDAYNPNTAADKVDDQVNRTTVGLTLTFAKISYAHIRLNYEMYDYKSRLAPNPTSNPKYLIVEFQTRL